MMLLLVYLCFMVNISNKPYGYAVNFLGCAYCAELFFPFYWIYSSF